MFRHFHYTRSWPLHVLNGSLVPTYWHYERTASMQKMLNMCDAHEAYFSSKTLSLFLKALVASNLQPVLQAAGPMFLMEETPQQLVPSSLPNWLEGEATTN